MASRPRKVTEMRASRRSARSTAPTTRRTWACESGSRRPFTTTSLALSRLEFRGDTATEPRISDSLVIGARHDSGELALDPVEVAERDRGVIQLARAHLLLHQMLDGAAHRFWSRSGQHPNSGLRRVGQHGDRSLGGLRTWPGIPEVGGI